MRLPLKIANENTQTRKKVGCVRRKKNVRFYFHLNALCNTCVCECLSFFWFVNVTNFLNLANNINSLEVWMNMECNWLRWWFTEIGWCGWELFAIRLISMPHTKNCVGHDKKATAFGMWGKLAWGKNGNLYQKPWILRLLDNVFCTGFL